MRPICELGIQTPLVGYTYVRRPSFLLRGMPADSNSDRRLSGSNPRSTYSEEAITQSLASLDETADDGFAESLVVADVVHQFVRRHNNRLTSYRTKTQLDSRQGFSTTAWLRCGLTN